MSSDRAHMQHTPEEERRIREAALDETIEQSFPASDPPSTDPNPDDDDLARRAHVLDSAMPQPDQMKTTPEK